MEKGIIRNYLKHTLIVVFLLCSTVFYSQKLSFGEMKNLLDKNLSDIEDELSKRSFLYINRDKEDNCDRYEFAFGKSEISNQAKSFVNIFFCSSSEKTITLVCKSSEHFPKIKEDSKKYGLKFIETDESNSDILVHKFANTNYRMEIISAKRENGNTSYIVSLTKL